MRTEQPPQAEPETWAVYRLIEAVYVQAVREAKRGNVQAVGFLDATLPDWRQSAQPKRRSGWRKG